MSWYNPPSSLVMEIEDAPGVKEYLDETGKRLSHKGAFVFMDDVNHKIEKRENKHLLVFSYRLTGLVAFGYWFLFFIPFLLAMFGMLRTSLVFEIIFFFAAFFTSPSLIYYTIKGVMERRGIETKTTRYYRSTSRINAIMGWS